MNTSTIHSLSVVFILLGTMFLSSCQDDAAKPSSTNDPAKEEKVKKVLALREDLSFVNRFVDENVVDISSEGGRRSFPQAIISRLKESAPCAEPIEEEQPGGSMKITMDFGVGCETEEGVEVSGKVIMIFSFTETSIQYELNFIDYSELSGENQGEVVNGTVAGSFIFDLNASTFIQEMEQDLIVTYPNGTEAGYKMAQQAEMTENGFRVASLTTSGNFADGGQFAMTVTKALVFDFSCEGDYPVQGEERLTFQGNTIVVNYGDGTCDDEYTVK